MARTNDQRPYIVALVSGGLDSLVLLGRCKEREARVHCVTVDYGQRNRVELAYAARQAAHFGYTATTVDLRDVGRCLSNNAMTGTAQVPNVHYTDQATRQVVVPNRNMLFLSLAAAIGIDRGCTILAAGIYAEGATHFPDTTSKFLYSFDLTLDASTESAIACWFPFKDLPKTFVVNEAHRLGLPTELAWTCYNNGPHPCGTCPSCQKRAEAFRLAGVVDAGRDAGIMPW
jgi:7-cyano-7-deazaguanine synthase